MKRSLLIIFLVAFLGVVGCSGAQSPEVPEDYYLYFEEDFSTDEQEDYWVSDCQVWNTELWDFCGWDSESETFRIYEATFQNETNPRSETRIKLNWDYGDIYEYTVNFTSLANGDDCYFHVERYFDNLGYDYYWRENGEYTFRLDHGRGDLNAEVILPNSSILENTQKTVFPPSSNGMRLGIYTKECDMADLRLDNIKVYKHEDTLDGRLNKLEYTVKELVKKVTDLWYEVFGGRWDVDPVGNDSIEVQYDNVLIFDDFNRSDQNGLGGNWIDVPFRTWDISQNTARIRGYGSQRAGYNGTIIQDGYVSVKVRSDYQ